MTPPASPTVPGPATSRGALALALAWLASGCGGAGTGAAADHGTTPEPEPEECTVAVRVEDAAGPEVPTEDIAPRMALTVVRICERAGTATLALPVETGVCTPAAPERGAIAAATCWWAGAGAVVEVVRAGGELVVRRTDYDEETPPGAPEEIGRLALPEGARTAALAP